MIDCHHFRVEKFVLPRTSTFKKVKTLCVHHQQGGIHKKLALTGAYCEQQHERKLVRRNKVTIRYYGVHVSLHAIYWGGGSRGS
jgi:hypothetical protein